MQSDLIHRCSKQRLLFKLKNTLKPAAVFATKTGFRLIDPHSELFEQWSQRAVLLGVYHRPDPMLVMEDIESLRVGVEKV